MLKYEFCISGLMNARLSVHCSLKRAKRRNYRLCTLTSSLKRAAPAQFFLKKYTLMVQNGIRCFLCNYLLEQGCFTSHLLSFDNNKVLKIINWIC